MVDRIANNDTATARLESDHRRRLVAIMFTDIVGFSSIVEQLGDLESRRIVELHDSLLREIIGRNGIGQVHKFMGDGVLATFGSPSEAISRALEIQRELGPFSKQHGIVPALSVRIGLHMGELVYTDRGDTELISRHVNCASRVMAVSDGGQILVSSPVFESSRGFSFGIPDRYFKSVSLGEFYLKGIGSMELYEIADTRLREPRPPRSVMNSEDPTILRRFELLGYRVIERIGAGGTGSVYLAERVGGESVGQRVAIKVLRAGLQQSPGSRTAFADAVKRASSIRLPGIVAIEEDHSNSTPPFFVMEYVVGVPVATAARELGWKEKALLVARVADVVSAAHEKGLVDGNLKPNNILVRSDGEIVILDFGLAIGYGRIADLTNESTLSISGASCYYVSPEQARHDEKIDERMDVYSLGVIFYEILTGHPPFTGETWHAVLSAHLYDSPQLPMSETSGVPGPLQRICLKMLEKDPADRYQSATAVAVDLRRVAEGQTVSVRPRLYDDLMGQRLGHHTNEIQSWYNNGLLTEIEYSELMRAYNHFFRGGLAAIMEPRLVHFGLVVLYIGGWLILNGAVRITGYCLVRFLPLLQTSWPMLSGGLAVIVPPMCYWLPEWYLYRRRSAFGCTISKSFRNHSAEQLSSTEGLFLRIVNSWPFSQSHSPQR
jgi:serine/threonine protein kinase